MIRIFLFLALLCVLPCKAQLKYNITGQVRDTSGFPLPGTSIWLYAGNDSLHTSCNEKGYFYFRQIAVNNFTLKVTMLGYEPLIKQYSGSDSITIYMHSRPEILQEIIIKSYASPVTMKDDTLEYNISQYHLRENALLEDLLKRLPGLEYDQTGSLKFMGQPIYKIRINGKDILVGTIHDLLRAIPLENIEKIQVIDDYGKMAELTGRKNGEANKIINLETKKGLGTNHSLNITAGGGTLDRYNTDIQASIMNDKKEITAQVIADNTVQGAGQTTYNKALILLRNQVNDKVYTNGGMFVESNKIRQETYSSAATITSAGIQNSNNECGNTDNTDSYYFVETLEFKTKKSNTLNFQISGQQKNQTIQNNTQSIQTGIQHIEQSVENISHISTPEISGNLYGSIHLPHQGELFAFGIDFDYITNRSNQYTNSHSLLYSADNISYKDSLLYQLVSRVNKNKIINAQASWIRPLSANSTSELNYTLKSNSNYYDLSTQWEDAEEKMRLIDSLSDQFNYNIMEHKVGVNIKIKSQKISLTLGANLFYALYNKNRQQWLVPDIDAALILNKKSKLLLHYEGHPNYPEYQQIHPVADRSNPLYTIIGNPSLSAALFNIISLNYRYTGKTLFYIRLSANPILNKIVSNVLLDKDNNGTIIQATHYLNTNGNYSMTGNYTWSIPFHEGEFQLFIEGSSVYRKNVYYLDNVPNTGNNIILTQAIRTGTYLKWIELNSGIGYSINRVNYSDKEAGSQEVRTWNFQLSPKFFIGKTWSIWADINKQLNSGYSGGITSNPTNLNATIEKKFLKNVLSCRLQGFNLLNQNTGLAQTIVGNTITQTRSNQLGRYMMLSIFLDLKKTRK